MAEKGNTYPRYSLPFTAEATETILRVSYKTEVGSTSISFIEDENTASKLRKIARWLTDASLKNSLLLVGGVGSGKTTTVKAIRRTIECLKASARSCKEKDKPEFWGDYSNKQTITVYDKVLNLKSLDIVSAINASDNIEKCTNSYFLSIDDLGCESTVVMEYGTKTTPLINLICKRYERKLPTIITSNLDIKDIASKYDKRLADRIMEDYDIIAFTNESYRRR